MPIDSVWNGEVGRGDAAVPTILRVILSPRHFRESIVVNCGKRAQPRDTDSSGKRELDCSCEVGCSSDQ